MPEENTAMQVHKDTIERVKERLLKAGIPEDKIKSLMRQHDLYYLAMVTEIARQGLLLNKVSHPGDYIVDFITRQFSIPKWYENDPSSLYGRRRYIRPFIGG